MSPSSTEELRAIAHEVPKHQLIIAGKKLHAEKYAIRKARSFLKNGDFLFCPAYELMYFLGAFRFCDLKRLSSIKREV